MWTVARIERSEIRDIAPGFRLRSTRATATKAGRQQIKLGRIRAACRGLHMLDHGEIALERRKKCRLGATLQHLAQEGASRRQHAAGEISGKLRERHDAQMVGRAVTR